MRSLILDDDNKSLFIKLHFEEVFNSFFINDDEYRRATTECRFVNNSKGIYQGTLHQDTINYLLDTVLDIKEHTVFLLFDNIRDLEENADIIIADLVSWYIKNNNSVVLSGISEKYQEILNGRLESRLSNKEQEKCRIIDFNDENEKNVINEKAENTLHKIIESTIKDCRIPYNKVSPSSPVRLKYYISIKRMLEEKNFFWMAIYELVLRLVDKKVVKKGSCKDNQNIILLATTMNGVTIGSIMSQLLEVEVIKIDHLGPSSELYPNSFQRAIDKKKQYLIVSDVICMGREISDAKAVLKMNGVNNVKVVSIVNIVPVGNIPKDVYCLYNVDKNHNEIHYQIDTDLSSQTYAE